MSAAVENINRPASTRIRISPRATAVTLAASAVAICVLGAFAHYILTVIVPDLPPQLGRGVKNAMRVVGLHSEPALQHWFSALAILACSVTTAVITLAVRRQDKETWGWMLFTLLLLFLATDEAIQIHEDILRPILHWVGISRSAGWQQIIWTIPFLLAGALLAIRFLITLDPQTAIRVCISCGFFIFGAVGIDIIGSSFEEREGIASLTVLVLITLEELIEMLAITMLLYTLLNYVERIVGPLNITFSGNPN